MSDPKPLRLTAKESVLRLTLKIEKLRSSGNPVDLEKLEKAVVDWEIKTHSKATDESNYTEIVKRKQEQLIKAFEAEKAKHVPPARVFRKITKEILDDIHSDVIKCRLKLRVLSNLPVEKLKEDFNSYSRICDLLKKKPPAGANEYYNDIYDQTEQLKASIEPKIKSVQDYFKMELDELVELESLPFGFLNRAVQLYGTYKFEVMAMKISAHIGGKACLKFE